MSATKTRSRRPVRRMLSALLTTVALGAGLAACTTGGGGDGESAAGGLQTESLSGGPGQAQVPGASADAAAGRTGGAERSVTAAGLLPTHVIQRATLTVRARDVGTALQRVRDIVAGVRGLVAAEHTLTTRRGEPRRSTLTLRVPAPAFGQTVQDLTRLGRLQSEQISTEDVSTEVVDVDARVLSAERTLRRIRELLEEADDFSDVLSLEAELARREADLASLKAQQAYLEDQTSMSTVSLTLLSPRKAVEPPEEEPAGFVTGLRVGWDALVALVSTVLTAVGVLLPLLLVLVPLGLLTWVLARRMLRRPGASPAPAQPSAD
jgi:hypothetical protein